MIFFRAIKFNFHFREAHIVNIKHHWWWKLNFVAQFFSFDHLVLLEEDHALTSDALHVMELMENLPNDSDLMALGHYKANLKLSPQVSIKNFIFFIWSFRRNDR